MEVRISRQAAKDLEKIPEHILQKLQLWVGSVKIVGIKETRKVKGYNDEALKGERYGQRSIRLSRSYRAIYRILSENQVEFLNIDEVNKHEY